MVWMCRSASPIVLLFVHCKLIKRELRTYQGMFKSWLMIDASHGRTPTCTRFLKCLAFHGKSCRRTLPGTARQGKCVTGASAVECVLAPKGRCQGKPHGARGDRRVLSKILSATPWWALGG